jgi:broad specificity phosphatase PhoE
MAAAAILLARHGQSDWNLEIRWQGHADRPLTELGQRQADALAERLAGVPLAAVYSSDLRRARATAEAAARLHGLRPVTLKALREVDVGSWSGLTRGEAAERFPEDYANWLEGGPGWRDGETYAQMAERVVRALRDIAERHLDEIVLVVTHAGPIRAAHAAAIGVDVHTYRRFRPVEPNARLSAVCLVDGTFTELCSAPEIDNLLAGDREERGAAAARPPSPAG